MGLIAGATLVRAQDAMWLVAPPSSSFNNGANWSGGAVPTGTAIFDLSNTTNVTLGAGTITTGALQFNAGAPAYSFSGTSNMSSRPREFHPQALLEPCMNLSIHTAPDVRPLP